jgi:GWxTD domain-containing protein
MLQLPLPAFGAGDSQLRKWHEGPIRYIAVKDEVQEYKRLESDSARALFIERFWRRRDPTPDTLTNEYRQLFWERVQQANASFLDSTKPGWMTDRGKIWILYGPPTDIEDDPTLKTDGLPAAGVGLIRWIYEGRPGQRMDVNPIVVVPFVRDSGGEYRVSYDPELSSVFFDSDPYRKEWGSGIDRYLDMMNAQPRSQLSVMLDLGRMQEVPPQEQILLDRVETMEAYQTRPTVGRVDRYYNVDERELTVVLTLDLSETGEGEKPAIVARFVPLDATRQPRLLGEDSFRITEVGEKRLAQGRLALEPGDYTITAMVADPVKVETGLYRGNVKVPAPVERFRFSDVTWALELESLRYASLASHSEPYHVGPFRVVPSFDDVFRRGESIKLFFEIYSAVFPVSVSYQLQGREDDGSWVSLGRPSTLTQEAGAVGWELPTSPRWPLGQYRVVVEATDAEGKLIGREVPFTLIEADPPAPETASPVPGADSGTGAP